MKHKLIEALEHRVLLAYAPPANPRVDVNLDASWKFNKGDVAGATASAFDDSTWAATSLPHTWNNLDGQDGGNDYYRGVGWYRRHYVVPSTYSGRQFYLKFDGAFLTTDVYVNGSFAGEHRGGYSQFLFDLNPFIHVGSDNVIAVKVNNANDTNTSPFFSGFAPDWTLSGGIYRDVHLLVTKTLLVNPLDYGAPGVQLYQYSVSSASASVKITTQVRNTSGPSQTASVVSTIVDAAGNIVKTLSSSVSVASKTTVNVAQSTSIASPHLWNGVKDPYCYTVYVQVKNSAGTVCDLMKQPLGFRTYKVDPKQGFLLNGQPYDLHGVALHQDRLNEGPATSAADRAEDISLLREIGATAVRLGHFQFSQDVYDQLDKYGIIAWSEIPLDANFTTTASFTDNLKTQLRETIRQNYNHPSIFFWGIANEMPVTTDGYNLVATLQAVAKSENGSRLTVAASNMKYDSDTAKLGTDLIGLNKYKGWYEGTTADLGPSLDSFHNSFPTRPEALAEFGAGGSIFQHTTNPTKPVPTRQPFHPEEYEDVFHEQSWAQIRSRPYLWSKFVWELTDSASDWRGEGDTMGRNDKGLVTYDRKTKKDAFYFYKANWSTVPTLYITSRRFTNRTAAATSVKVYSNCTSVTLAVNGVTIGTTTPSSIKVAKWNATLQPGANTITVTGTKGGLTYSDTCTWTLTTTTTSPKMVAAAPPPAASAASRFSVQQVRSDLVELI